jgi:hypothetical protein
MRLWLFATIAAALLILAADLVSAGNQLRPAFAGGHLRGSFMALGLVSSVLIIASAMLLSRLCLGQDEDYYQGRDDDA